MIHHERTLEVAADPGNIWAMPSTEAHAATAIEPLVCAEIRVIWSMDCAVKYAPVGWLLGKP